jgi:membrane protein
MEIRRGESDMTFHTSIRLVKDAGGLFRRNKGPRLGAALAYYFALSVAPLLMIAVAVAGFVYGSEAARGGLADRLRDALGDAGAEALQATLARHTQTAGVITTVVAVVAMLIGAAGVFSQLQEALDTLWGVSDEDRPGGFWAIVRDELKAFLAVGGMAILLIASLAAGTVLTAVGGYVPGWVADSEGWLRAANLLLSFALTTLTFALVFTVLPHRRPAWSDVWLGAAITAALFTLGKYLIGLYLGRAAVGSAYGAAGSFVALLVWVYYSAQILLFGAAFTHVYATRMGTGLRPTASPARSPAPAPA